MNGIEARNSGIHGTGVFANRRFKKGEVIGEYTGEKISSDEADDRYEDAEMFYIFMLDDGTCIDPVHDDNPMKYINHSCDANCESIEEDGRIFVKAIKTIRPGRELTYDYCVVAEDDEELTCCCGCMNCRGTMKAEAE